MKSTSQRDSDSDPDFNSLKPIIKQSGLVRHCANDVAEH